MTLPELTQRRVVSSCNKKDTKEMTENNPNELTDTIEISWLSNDGGGFAQVLTLRNGATLAQVFSAHMPGKRPENYRIRLRRAGESSASDRAVSGDTVLRDGDEVSLTMNKIQGA